MRIRSLGVTGRRPPDVPDTGRASAARSPRQERGALAFKTKLDYPRKLFGGSLAALVLTNATAPMVLEKPYFDVDIAGASLVGAALFASAALLGDLFFSYQAYQTEDMHFRFALSNFNDSYQKGMKVIRAADMSIIPKEQPLTDQGWKALQATVVQCRTSFEHMQNSLNLLSSNTLAISFRKWHRMLDQYRIAEAKLAQLDRALNPQQ
jgi:hypothetical protein